VRVLADTIRSEGVVLSLEMIRLSGPSHGQN
jgi:hypothetical protein